MTVMAVAHADHAPKVYGPYSRGMAVGNLADPARVMEIARPGM
jgi:uncharacterized protein YwgA